MWLTGPVAPRHVGSSQTRARTRVPCIGRQILNHCATREAPILRFLKELKIELPYDPAIPLLGIYPEKTILQKESGTTRFITALFTISRTWKQPKCPSTDEWIKKMWHIYTMEYYSDIKRNEIELFVVRWMDLESVIQSEVSQKEKNKYRMLTHIYGI